jgi:hypothetical protein
MDFEKLKNFAQTYAFFSLATSGLITAIAGMPVVSSAVIGVTVCYAWLVLPQKPLGDSRFARLIGRIGDVMLVQAFVVSIALVLLGLMYGLR